MFLGKHCFWFEWKLFFRCTVKFSLICSKNISYLWWILGLPCLVSLLTFKGIADIFFLILFVDYFLNFFILCFFLSRNIYFGMFWVFILISPSFGDTFLLLCLFQGLVYMVWIFLDNLELLDTVFGSVWLYSDS